MIKCHVTFSFIGKKYTLLEYSRSNWFVEWTKHGCIGIVKRNARGLITITLITAHCWVRVTSKTSLGCGLWSATLAKHRLGTSLHRTARRTYFPKNW